MSVCIWSSLIWSPKKITAHSSSCFVSFCNLKRKRMEMDLAVVFGWISWMDAYLGKRCQFELFSLSFLVVCSVCMYVCFFYVWFKGWGVWFDCICCPFTFQKRMTFILNVKTSTVLSGHTHNSVSGSVPETQKKSVYLGLLKLCYLHLHW